MKTKRKAAPRRWGVWFTKSGGTVEPFAGWLQERAGVLFAGTKGEALAKVKQLTADRISPVSRVTFVFRVRVLP